MPVELPREEPAICGVPWRSTGFYRQQLDQIAFALAPYFQTSPMHGRQERQWHVELVVRN